jgi:hypothetical protein
MCYSDSARVKPTAALPQGTGDIKLSNHLRFRLVMKFLLTMRMC